MITEAFLAILPAARTTARGWYTFNCPACGDRRRRGGLLPTSDGGFRYRCFNGGCEFEEPTGWSPDSPLGKRPRRLFALLGGDPSSLPSSGSRFPATNSKAYSNGKDWSRQAVKFHTDFPEVPLPRGSITLWDATGQDAEDCREYLEGRTPWLEDFPFVWSPEQPRRVIIPLTNNGKNIGWISRAIDANNPIRYLKCPEFPTGFMLNQDRFVSGDGRRMVMQNPFDAMVLKGLATFGSRLSIAQAALLCKFRGNRNIILIPDFKGEEWKSYLQAAETYNFRICCPEWATEYKDAGEALTNLGLLLTTETIMESITDNYELASTFLRAVTRASTEQIH
jgi:hypothetical protein